MHPHLFRRPRRSQRPRRHRVLALASVLASASALAIASSAPASAATSHPADQSSPAAAAASGISQCPQYSLCLWRNVGYGGTMWDWTNSTTPHDEWLYVGAAANDQASSLYNDRDNLSWIAKDYIPTNGDYEVLNPGESRSNLLKWYWIDSTTENDSISAIMLY